MLREIDMLKNALLGENGASRKKSTLRKNVDGEWLGELLWREWELFLEGERNVKVKWSDSGS
jgi:hypothetical protein